MTENKQAQINKTYTLFLVNFTPYTCGIRGGILVVLFGVPLEPATSNAGPKRAYLHILHLPNMSE